jgi:hypothetical protein
LDDNVSNIKNRWYQDVRWSYYDIDGNEKRSFGIYLICLICPFKHEGCATQKGYFSSNLESVGKDVECLFGILKKRWKILKYDIRFPDIKVCKKVFFVCSILHNMMLDGGETRDNSERVGRGGPLEGDAIWLRDMPDERSALLPLHLRRPWLDSGTSIGMIWLHTTSTWPEQPKGGALRK